MMRHMSLAAALCLAASSANADLHGEAARLTVLPGWQTEDGGHMAGLRITLAPGWKTYWRAPGDAGIPPRLLLDSISTVEDVQLLWPVPEVMDQGGMRAIGYTDGVVVPMLIATSGDGIQRVSGVLDVGVCEEICLPLQFSFDLMLPVPGARDGQIVAALLDQPMTAADEGLAEARCRVSPAADGISLRVELDGAAALQPVAVLIETADPGLWVSEADVERSGDDVAATVDLVPLQAGQAVSLDRSGVVITALGERSAVEYRGCVAG